MRRIGELIRNRYALGGLSTGAYAFYEPLGWERWRGPTFVDRPSGRERTPGDDGDVMILQTPRSPLLDLDGDIVCDWQSWRCLVTAIAADAYRRFRSQHGDSSCLDPSRYTATHKAMPDMMRADDR